MIYDVWKNLHLCRLSSSSCLVYQLSCFFAITLSIYLIIYIYIYIYIYLIIYSCISIYIYVSITFWFIYLAIYINKFTNTIIYILFLFFPPSYLTFHLSTQLPPHPTTHLSHEPRRPVYAGWAQCVSSYCLTGAALSPPLQPAIHRSAR